MTYTEAIDYLSSEAESWNGNDKNNLEDALEKLNGDQPDKEAAMVILNDLYWDSNQVTHQCLFGQAVFVISYTVDPLKPFPSTRPS